jgi:hypothetical protein
MSHQELTELKKLCEQRKEEELRVVRKNNAKRSPLMDKFLAVGMNKEQRAKVHDALNQGKLAQPQEKPALKLYPIKIEPNETVLTVKVNLKNMELWLTDFTKENCSKRGQIL